MNVYFVTIYLSDEEDLAVVALEFLIVLPFDIAIRCELCGLYVVFPFGVSTLKIRVCVPFAFLSIVMVVPHIRIREIGYDRSILGKLVSGRWKNILVECSS